MILSDKMIRELISNGELCVDPIEDIQIQPASVDVRLGTSFSVIKNENSILRMDVPIEYHSMTAETFLLLPKQFVLATTIEYFRLPDNLTAFVEGRSSIGRLGLFIQNAG